MSDVILVVEDEKTSQAILENMLTNHGYKVVTANHGKEALDYMTAPEHRVDLVMLDHMMPIMDGLSFMEQFTEVYNFKQPVIMVTGADGTETITQAIERGVFYYLTKPVQEDVLLSIVAKAIEHYKRHSELRDIANKHFDVKAMLKEARFKARTFGDMRILSRFLSGFYPDPSSAIVGIYELLVNALEHGNLEIDYALKKQLIQHMNLDVELHKRSCQEPYCDRWVEVGFRMEDERIVLDIEDEGPGFDVAYFTDVVARQANESTGRGIMIAKELSFDQVDYNAKGNKVQCIKQLQGG